MQFDPLSFLLGTAVIIAGWIIVHRLNSSRDREAREYAAWNERETRKRNFLSFMAQWRSEIERANQMNITTDYEAKVHLFRAEVGVIRGNFEGTRQARLDELVRTLSSISRSEIAGNQPDPNHHGRNVIAPKIDDVVKFVEEN